MLKRKNFHQIQVFIVKSCRRRGISLKLILKLGSLEGFTWSLSIKRWFLLMLKSTVRCTKTTRTVWISNLWDIKTRFPAPEMLHNFVRLQHKSVSILAILKVRILLKLQKRTLLSSPLIRLQVRFKWCKQSFRNIWSKFLSICLRKRQMHLPERLNWQYWDMPLLFIQLSNLRAHSNLVLTKGTILILLTKLDPFRSYLHK